MLNKEVIQRVQSLYSKGVQSDDSRLSARHIYNKLKSVRALLLSQKVKKDQMVSQQSYQTLKCLKLVKASKHECNCLPSVDCNVFKAEEKIPNMISGFYGIIIDSVSSVDGEILFDRKEWKTSKYNDFNKYTSKNPIYFVKDNVLFIANKKRIEFVSVRALFEDVIEVNNVNIQCESEEYCCEECVSEDTCKSVLDMEFNIDTDLIEPLIKLSVEELIGVFNQNIEDITNNSRDNVVQQTK